jgi:hypothetical protein
MEWWHWLIVALVVLAVLAGLVLAIQARRRSGGVIASGGRGRRGNRG